FGANALAADFYPTAARATGIGWALGIGRIGSIIGPFAGGVLIALAWRTGDIFLVSALPALVASAAVFLMGKSAR
ncbi:MAG: MFS transporter, partial [Sphingomonadales bacterium]|nr:MFS transporter [Sphingomonadales bacterium]